MTRLEIIRPDDWHVHFRDGAAVLADTVPPVARVFGRAIAMPNLPQPIDTTKQALAYAERLRKAAKREGFTPLVSLYLTDRTGPDEIARAAAAGLVAVKLYPAGVTTHSAAGITDLSRLDPVLEAMSEAGLVLQLHGEVADPECDVFDREARFVETVLDPLCERHPDLRIVLEHVTSAAGVSFVGAAGDRVAATVTAHHLAVDRNDLFRGGLHPHLYCLPLPKTRRDREALTDAVMSGHPRFFLGSDSAPHPRSNKESGCCPAGVYTGHHAILHYAEAFGRHGALEHLEGFASLHGARFYGVPPNDDTIALERVPTAIPATLRFGDEAVVPFRAGEQVGWRLL